MKRRKLLCGSGIIIALLTAGCSSDREGDSGTDDMSENNGGSEVDSGTDDMSENNGGSEVDPADDFERAVFFVRVIFPEPENTQMVDITDTGLLEIAPVSNAFTKAREKREEFTEDDIDDNSKDSYEYKTIVNIGITDYDVYEKIRTELNNVPREDLDNIPIGHYLEYERELYHVRLIEEH
ncbi:hypothetical protein ACLI4Z_17715 [Natrialbaceae archaeon A-arb3/5]